ncbi:MAG TPA: imidazolonepropionase [Egibacteraceae bacterium]|nr:imidazolonepropionase [Egibacteraceae bacterium]
MTATLLRGIGRLFTATDAGVLEGAALVLRDDRIAWVGSSVDAVPPGLAADVSQEVDVGGALVTPGLIDAHTHPVYAGQRFAEVAARSAGLSYAHLGDGAGIAATVAATRTQDWASLAAAVRARLVAWAAGGATTVEAKTGYHLTHDGELDSVRLLQQLRGGDGLPHIEVTFLAAHALPPEHGDGEWTAYAEEVASWASDAAEAGARHCDVFCDEGYFTVAQARLILNAGKAAGLVPRIHADELAHLGGSQLAAEIGAASADHLLRVTDADARALAAAGVAATLCPGTALSIGPLPDVRTLRARGVTIALGSDHNPGTSGITSMSTVIALAVAALGLSVDEALLAATRGGARSLRLDDRGTVVPGARADLVSWDAEHEGAFAWSWDLRPRGVWLAGQPLLAL